jgi:hypothetical protein
MATNERISTPSRARARGRPTAYTAELGEQLCKLVGLGVPIGVACRAEGIGKRTLYRWREFGAAGREPYVGFVRKLNRSLAKAEAAITLHVVRAAQRDWRAGAWWLERRHPQRYGAKQTLRLEKGPGEMSDAELDNAIAKYGYVRASAPIEEHADE